MCEITANVILAEQFAERFDGFSIGSNDLTQLTLGIDRDSERLSSLFSEEDGALIASIQRVIKKANKAKRKSVCAARHQAISPSLQGFWLRPELILFLSPLIVSSE
jgi:pyruvate,water dikinase